MKDWKAGTCTGGGASTFADTARTEPDDYFQNTVPVSKVTIWSTTDGAAPQGQTRTISDWVNSTGTGTVSAAWTTANPASGDKYAITTEYALAEILQALNDAIEAVKGSGLIEKIDTSVPTIDSVYEYDIPTGFTHIHTVTMSTSDGVYNEPIPPNMYIVLRGLAVPRLKFLLYPSGNLAPDVEHSGLWADTKLAGGYTLRIEGFGYQATLVNYTDLCALDPMYVSYQAAALLHARRITRIDTEPQGHQAQYQICQAVANDYKPKGFKGFPPDVKRVL